MLRHKARECRALALLGMTLFCGLASCADTPKENAVTLETVNFEKLMKAIEGQKGKVVVLDVWGEFWLPCKKKFPHLVQMHKELAKSGLVVMTLSVDEPENEKKALEFLKKQEATFPNFLIMDSDENREKWEKKLPHNAPPILHVFDKTGKLAKTFESDAKQQEVDDFIKDLLK